MRVSVLQPTPGDAEIVAGFLAETFMLEHRFGEERTLRIDTGTAWEHIWHHVAHGRCFVASDEDGIAGSLAIAAQTLWWSGRPYLADGWFYVRPQKRGTHAATMLLNAAEQWARKIGLPIVVKAFHSGTDQKLFGKFLGRRGYQTLGGIYIKEAGPCVVAETTSAAS